MWVVPVGAEFTQGEGKTEGADQAGRTHTPSTVRCRRGAVPSGVALPGAPDLETQEEEKQMVWGYGEGRRKT